MGQLVSNSDFQEVLGGTQKVRILLISDSPVTLYYDGEEYGKLDISIPKPIECTIGTHTFSVVSTEFPEIRKNIPRDCSNVDEGKTITVSLRNEIAKIKRKDSMKSFAKIIKEMAQHPKAVLYTFILSIILLVVVVPLFIFFEVSDFWYIPIALVAIGGHVVLHYAKKATKSR